MAALFSLRVSPYQWGDRDRLAETVDLVREHSSTIREVALFTHANHPAMPLAKALETARELGDALRPFKALGIRAGINVLATIGHLDENLEGSLSEPWQHLVGADGAVSASCYCWYDERVRGYVHALYRAMAATGAEFLWVDDDIRLVGYRPNVMLACFCPLCLDAFARQTGRRWERAELVAAFDGGTRGQRLALRRAWLEKNRRHVAALLADARAAVDEVAPGLPLGFMTVDATWAGQGYAGWADALRSGAAGRAAPKWRPGGGFYTDEQPRALLLKAHATARQVSWLPADVADIQYEHENGPYFPLEKSRRIFAAEMPAAVGAGCTGIALNVSLFLRHPLEEVHPWLDAAAGIKPLVDAAVDAMGTAARAGVWRAGTEDTLASKNADGAWLGPSALGYDAWEFTAVSETGLPAAYRADGAVVTMLAGDEVVQFGRDELERMLSGAVIMDGPALARVEEMGLGGLAGFRVAGRREVDTLERLSADPLNGRFAGWHRDGRPSFWSDVTYLLEPVAGGARVLSTVEDFFGRPLGAGSGCFENARGGRVAVRGYFPWKGLLGLSGSSQLKAVCRWLSRDTLPAYVASWHKSALWCVPGRAVLLLNASIDPAEGLEVCVRGAATATLVRHGGERARIAAARQDGPYGAFALPRLEAWEAALLL